MIENFTTFDNSSGKGVFTPYTALTTLRNVSVTGNVSAPGGTGFAINDVTRDMIYDHVYAVGWETGIDVPVNGTTTINGGFFNDINGLLIKTAQSRTRAVNIYSNSDRMQPQFGTLSATALKTRQQFDIKLQSNFDNSQNDITRIFNPDVIRMGTVTLNNQQLYYKEQAANFKPFDSTAAARRAVVCARGTGGSNQSAVDGPIRPGGGWHGGAGRCRRHESAHRCAGRFAHFAAAGFATGEQALRESGQRPISAVVQVLQPQRSEGESRRLRDGEGNDCHAAGERLEPGHADHSRPDADVVRVWRQHSAELHAGEECDHHDQHRPT